MLLGSLALAPEPVICHELPESSREAGEVDRVAALEYGVRPDPVSCCWSAVLAEWMHSLSLISWNRIGFHDAGESLIAMSAGARCAARRLDRCSCFVLCLCRRGCSRADMADAIGSRLEHTFPAFDFEDLINWPDEDAGLFSARRHGRDASF